VTLEGIPPTLVAVVLADRLSLAALVADAILDFFLGTVAAQSNTFCSTIWRWFVRMDSYVSTSVMMRAMLPMNPTPKTITMKITHMVSNISVSILV
jgi:hypothetical protein